MDSNSNSNQGGSGHSQSQGQGQRPRFVVPSVAAALDAPSAAQPNPHAHRQPPPLPPAPAPVPGYRPGPAVAGSIQEPPLARPPSMGPPVVPTGPSARPAWQQRANANPLGPPPPPPPGSLFGGPPGPQAGVPPPGGYGQQSIYHEGAQPLTSSGGPTSRADYARKRKALNDDDLFKLPDLPGAHPAPASSSSSSASAPSSSSAAPSTNPSAVLAPRSSTAASGIGSAIQVNPRQRGNPVLDHIRAIAWEYAEGTPADYVVGTTAGVLFLSVKYHRLHPEYIVQRIRGIQGNFELRVLLVLVDVGDYASTVKEVNALCVANDLTLMLAWSNEECAKYLEMYKAMEHRPPDALMGRQEEDYSSRLTDALTQIKGVNRTDVLTLSATFGTFAKIVQAGVTDLASCPGIGEKKAQRIYEAFRKPFIAAADALPLEDD